MSVIRTEKLTKFYLDDRGIIDLDLTVAAGEVSGPRAERRRQVTTIVCCLN